MLCLLSFFILCCRLITYNINKILNTMSEKSKANRARREAREEKQGKQIVKWIFGVLIVLAIAYAVMFSAMQ